MKNNKNKKKQPNKIDLSKIYNIFKYILTIINIIISIILVINLEQLNVLPTKYFLIAVGVLILINAISLLLIYRKNKILRTIGIILSIILITISTIGIVYINSTNKFLDNSFNNHVVEISTYNIIVLQDSKYKELNDLKDKKLGYLKEQKDPLNKLNEAINTLPVPYEDLYELYELLISKELDAILIDQEYIPVLEEDYKDINDKVRIIYSFNLETKIEKEETKQEDEIVRPINIYISGSDSNAPTIGNKTRSDVNMIVTINPKTHQVLLTSIPRDYYVMVHGQTGLKDKLTHAGIYGLDVSTSTVEDIFGIEIDYSIKVGFQSVVEVVDLVGGIEVYSDTEYSYPYENFYVKKGMNKFDGAQALRYARERKKYIGGDRHRIKNQQQVLEAVLKKIMVNKSLLLKYDELLSSLSNLYRTDIPKEVVTEFVKYQLDSMPTWTFESQTVDGKGAMLPTHTAPKYKRSVIIPDQETVDKASYKIKELMKK